MSECPNTRQAAQPGRQDEDEKSISFDSWCDRWLGGSIHRGAEQLRISAEWAVHDVVCDAAQARDHLLGQLIPLRL